MHVPCARCGFGVVQQPEMGAVRAADLGLAPAVASLPPVDTAGCGVGLVGPPRKRLAPRPALACVPLQQLRQAAALWPHLLCLTPYGAACSVAAVVSQVPPSAFSNVTTRVPQGTGHDAWLTGGNLPPACNAQTTTKQDTACDVQLWPAGSPPCFLQCY